MVSNFKEKRVWPYVIVNNCVYICYDFDVQQLRSSNRGLTMKLLLFAKIACHQSVIHLRSGYVLPNVVLHLSFVRLKLLYGMNVSI